ncbi:MAG: EamA family transporter [Euzebya tangerina]|nr:EamA family transporter [Euzebya tangerina]
MALRTALTPMVWGTTYLVTTELLPDGRPLLAAMLRALPIGVAFLLWSRRLPHGSWWWKAGMLGVLNIGAFFALLFVAAFRLPGGVAATAGAIQPLIAAGLAALLLGERLTRRTAVSGGLGVAGVAMLVLGPAAALDAIGVLAALAGTVSMATGVVLTKHWGRPVDLVTFTGWQLTAGGLVLLPLVVIIEGLPAEVSGTSLLGLAWLSIVGTGWAYANWFKGIQQLPVASVSFLALLSPVVATLLGWVALDQRLSMVQVLGALLVVAAVVGAQTPRRVPAARVRATNVQDTGADMPDAAEDQHPTSRKAPDVPALPVPALDVPTLHVPAQRRRRRSTCPEPAC